MTLPWRICVLSTVALEEIVRGLCVIAHSAVFEKKIKKNKKDECDKRSRRR